mmetsp:Transcript_23153/g.29731  ORF Transcript_23153/g.29731 Transcript_23153/m.29731 type:complete len:88 (+) Transcript_23153:83-346(+)
MQRRRASITQTHKTQKKNGNHQTNSSHRYAIHTYSKFNSFVSSNNSSSSSVFGGGIPATGQQATPMVLRVTVSLISCASLGLVTQVL